MLTVIICFMAAGSCQRRQDGTGEVKASFLEGQRPHSKLWQQNINQQNSNPSGVLRGWGRSEGKLPQTTLPTLEIEQKIWWSWKQKEELFQYKLFLHMWLYWLAKCQTSYNDVCQLTLEKSTKPLAIGWWKMLEGAIIPESSLSIGWCWENVLGSDNCWCNGWFPITDCDQPDKPSGKKNRKQGLVFIWTKE